MKEIKTLREGSNFTAVTVGKLDKVSEYSLPLGESVVINGKVFTGDALKSTGMEMSLQTFAPGEGSAFVHAHKEHEELYMVISGEGEFRVTMHCLRWAKAVSYAWLRPESVRCATLATGLCL